MVHCQSGARSAAAASFLRARGFNVSELAAATRPGRRRRLKFPSAPLVLTLFPLHPRRTGAGASRRGRGARTASSSRLRPLTSATSRGPPPAGKRSRRPGQRP
ncbi:hypothetical protein [Deinococcus radiodurans]|uniref:hypothetical protein n=1 Tax=Deinococcus radiodurans TaxID=1299 RepID=UPI0030B84D98